MRITVLVDNETSSPELIGVHGLSLLIETKEQTILFDMGPDDTLLNNAKTLDKNLDQVDVAIISHGHNDHGGGLKAFMEVNGHAPIYLSRHAFDPHLSIRKGIPTAIGLDPDLRQSERIIMFDQTVWIAPNIMLFHTIKGQKHWPKSNQNLRKQDGDRLIPDPFDHEINLVIEADGHHLLIAGCAHHGIENILDAANAFSNQPITDVISGFHMFSRSSGNTETNLDITMIARRLQTTNVSFHTLHCTGVKAYERMKVILQDRLDYASVGRVIELN
ncbi:MAG: MBL fold metallo-hydrolase [Acholeplasmataceae bacterium]|nr:MBL fold metallo-hydrolase [Acholeplasmataceae bacterium]